MAVIVMSPESITVEEGDEDVKLGCLSLANSTVDITVYDSLQSEGQSLYSYSQHANSKLFCLNSV